MAGGVIWLQVMAYATSINNPIFPLFKHILFIGSDRYHKVCLFSSVDQVAANYVNTSVSI